MFAMIIDRKSEEYVARFRNHFRADMNILNSITKVLEEITKNFPTFSFEKFVNKIGYACYIDIQCNHVQAMMIMNDFEKAINNSQKEFLVAYTLKKEGCDLGTLFVVGEHVDYRCKNLMQLEKDLIRFGECMR